MKNNKVIDKTKEVLEYSGVIVEGTLATVGAVCIGIGAAEVGIVTGVVSGIYNGVKLTTNTIKTIIIPEERKKMDEIKIKYKKNGVVPEHETEVVKTLYLTEKNSGIVLV